MIQYKCDGVRPGKNEIGLYDKNLTCVNTSEDLFAWITIGSSDGGSLVIKNENCNRRLVSVGNYRDLHFCSAKCMCNYFFEMDDVNFKDQEK